MVAIAARDLSRAQELAKRFDILNAYDDYSKIAQDSNVEIVIYVGNIIPPH